MQLSDQAQVQLIVSVAGFATLIFTTWWSGKTTRNAAAATIAAQTATIAAATAAQTETITDAQHTTDDGVQRVHELANNRLSEALKRQEELAVSVAALKNELSQATGGRRPLSKTVVPGAPIGTEPPPAAPDVDK